MAKFIRWLTLPRLIAAITVLGVCAMAFRAPLDTDTYWHLRAGQWQMEHRALLSSDIFSFTRDGQAWLNVHWLSQIVLYGFYVAFGETGLALFTATLAAGGMALIYLACEGDALLRSFSVFLGAATAAVFWSARSQMISFLLSAVVVYLLWQYQKRGVDRLWIIPILMIPWANSHGGFAIAFVLLALAMLGEIARWVVVSMKVRQGDVSTDQPTLRRAVRIGVIMAASAAAVLINPYGVDTLLLPFRTVGISVLRDFIQEWASPNFHLPQMWPFAVMVVGTLLAAGVSSRRLDVRDAMMLGGTAISALLAARNIPTFALVAAPILALHTESFLGDLHIRLNSGRVAARGGYAAINGALLVLVTAGVAVKMILEMLPVTLEKTREERLPVGAVSYLEQHHPPRELFNSYNWGGYLIWQARDYPVYIDGRTDLYDDPFIRDYLRMYYAQPGWESKLDAAGINTVLIEDSSPLAQVLSISPGWEKVYSDKLAVIYVRAGSIGP